MPPTDLTPLWTRVRAMFARAVAAFGAPAALAALGVLSRAWRREVGGWLAPLEHIVRKLLLAEAARLDETPSLKSWSAPLRGGSQPRATPPKRGGAARSNLDTASPETWRVQFALSLPRDPRAVPETRAPHIRSFAATPSMPPSPTTTPQRAPRTGLDLARRVEALRRVLDDPMPHARRLLRVLVRALRRFPEIVFRIIAAGPRTTSRDDNDLRLPTDVCIAAFDAAPAFNSS